MGAQLAAARREARRREDLENMTINSEIRQGEILFGSPSVY